MQNLFLLLLILLTTTLFVPACTRDAVSSVDPIRFDQLAVGQRSRYIGLDGENYRQGNGSEFVHSADTLVLEIVGQDAQGFQVNEVIHYGAGSSNWNSHSRDSTYSYYLTVTNDTLHLVPNVTDYLRSRLFVYYSSSDGLPLAEFADPKVDIKGWKADFPFCACRETGFTKKYRLFGKKYPRLNVLMDNTAMQTDGLGHTYVYSAKEGLVKCALYNAWTADGYGWDLLPN